MNGAYTEIFNLVVLARRVAKCLLLCSVCHHNIHSVILTLFWSAVDACGIQESILSICKSCIYKFYCISFLHGKNELNAMAVYREMSSNDNIKD